MTQVFLFVILAILAVISMQDFRFRAVSWFLFPLGILALLLWNASTLSWPEIFQSQLINLAFLFFQIVVLLAVFKMKSIGPSMVFKSYIGLGDMLFFLLLALGLPSTIFLMFFLGTSGYIPFGRP